MDILSPITEVKGIGEKTALLFNKLGVYTTEDILLFFPRTYIKYPSVSDQLPNSITASPVALRGRLHVSAKTVKGKRLDITTATVFLENGAVECVWFRAPYIRNQLEVGKDYIFYGVLKPNGVKYKMEMPTIFKEDAYNKLIGSMQPVYHLTKGLNNNSVRKAVSSVCDLVKLDEDRLPEYIIEQQHFMPYSEAIRKYHFPGDFDELYEARRRLAYEEMFYFILNSKISQRDFVARENNLHIENKSIVEETIAKLPFELTKGQSDTIVEIRADLIKPYVTQRLVQGDVGSGKTMVAFLAMLDVVANGYQAAIMAPTEVLAVQHYHTFMEYMERFDLPYKVALITGSLKQKERKENQAIIDENDSCFIVGTHALISDKTSLNNLALVVTDEQHRFGVLQREIFSEKGGLPHIVVMSATPIPRTLAMILYGNMNTSVISEMPSNRKQILSCVIKSEERNKAFSFITKEAAKGHQVYIICPLVEASDATEAENVTDYAAMLSNTLGEKFRIGLLHGKMKPADKNQIMEDFADHNIDILVSTTVVEVGINVPNATIIMIEDANRFGLAQLHQLRGRVGRGEDQSYCILMNSADNKEAAQRLDIVLKSHSGFDIAKEDLKLRGPGDIMGIRQSGDFDFKIADIIQDAKELEAAASDVEKIIEKDPELSDNPGVKNALQRYLINSNNTL